MTDLLAPRLRSPSPTSRGGVTIEQVDRDLTWLEVCEGALREARDASVTLSERIRLQALVAAELDDLFMSRIGRLRQSKAGNAEGPTLGNFLSRIRARAEATARTLYENWRSHVEPELARRCGIAVLRPERLTGQERAHLEQRFLREVWPLLTPLAVDQGHPFPRLRNRGLNLALMLDHRGHRIARRPMVFVVLPLPVPLMRVLEVGTAGPEEARYILLEDLVMLHVGQIFPGFRVTSCSPFRVTQTYSECVVAAERAGQRQPPVPARADRRSRGHSVRLEVTEDTPAEIVSFLASSLGLEPGDLYRVNGPLYLQDLSRLCGTARACGRCAIGHAHVTSSPAIAALPRPDLGQPPA